MSVAIFSDAAVWDAVAEVAGLKNEPDKVDEGIAQLHQLSLVHKKEGRYGMLSLTREYVFTELAKNPEFEKEARERWVKWYLDFAQKHGGRDWGEYHIQYDYLEQEWGNMLAVLHWCAAQAPERYANLKNLWQCLHNYTDLYGHWNDRLFWLNWFIEASQRRGDWSTAVYTMSEKIWTLTQMAGKNNVEAADSIFHKAWSLRDYANSEYRAYLAINKAIISIKQQKYEEARNWVNSLNEIVSKANDLEEILSKRLLIDGFYFEAESYYQEDKSDKAKQLYQNEMQLAEEIRWQLAEIYGRNSLAKIAIKQNDLNEAEKLLNTGLSVAERNKHKLMIASYQASFARLEKARGNTEKVREWATKAKDSFQRLWMTENSEEMRCLLDELE